MNLIIGKNGQLGKELCHLFDEQHISYTATSSKDLDITDKLAVDYYFYRNKPQVVYLCAGYTNVEKAEKEESHLALQVNYWGTRYIAEAVERAGGILIYISTDYVFSGKLNTNQKWEVESETYPLSEYGQTKLLGEFAVIDSKVKHFIIRTSWLFGSYGKNFALTMMEQAKKQKEIKVVNDQYSCPTWTRTLAEFMHYLIAHNSEPGIYHLSNALEDGKKVSWFDFAKYILRKETVKVLPISSETFPSQVKRPFNSTLSIKKSENTGFLVPTWQEAVDEIFHQKID